MTKLEELRKLAREATPMPELLSKSYKDMKFMGEVRNNIEALLDIAEAAKKFDDVCSDCIDREFCEDIYLKLGEALDKLK